MNAAAQNPLIPPVIEVPDATDEFGQDGGKFYRCYDALADEIDDDMVERLKGQLDGLLIFAGLFAGVNTAFLALTLPLLSADSADDTNALLAQILIQLAAGRNDSVPTNSALPSAGFSPAGNIFTINALFALSLAFAIISSFLAVLGRQWLFYYRKRSGGGAERQRWEQLKRYLGAERWQLEPILDDVLPSLLQIGLIIFCVSLLLYLRHLSPSISMIVGILLYVGLAFFVGSALCTSWDRFCPFHSPLSHMLFWSARKIRSAWATVKALKWDQISTFSLKPLLDILIHGRVEESLQSLQAIAIQRAISTSDDPLTLLSATANIFAITAVAQMEQLWSDRAFRERFLDQVRKSYSRGLQLRGQNQVNFAMAVQRLYCAAAAHCILLLDIEWNDDDFYELRCAVYTLWETPVLVPGSQISNSPACLIRGTLAFSIIQFYTYGPSSEAIKAIRNHLVICSSGQKHQDWKFLGVLSFIVSILPYLENISGSNSLGSFRRAYRWDTEHAAVTLRKAFDVLVDPESGDRLDLDHILINILRYALQMVTGDHTHRERTSAILEICEPVLQDPVLLAAGPEIMREIRFDFTQAWERECDVGAKSHRIPIRLFDMLDRYFQKVRTTYQADLVCDESVTFLQAFGPPTRKLFSHHPINWQARSVIREKRKEFRNMFNKFVMEVDALSRRNQNHARRVRDPDERWCHWQEQSASIRDLYCLPPDSPYSGWEADRWF